MPYSGPNDDKLPEHVQDLPKDKREQWVAIWNSTYSDCMEDNGDKDDCEAAAFALASGTVKTSPFFFWDAIANRFRRKDNGQFVSTKRMTEERDKYLAQEQKINAELAQQLFDKEITIQEFESRFKRNIVRTYTVQYILARGGRASMTQRDWGIIGAAVKKQYQFANNFMTELAAGRYTTNQVSVVANRMGLYTSSSGQMYERGTAEVIGGGKLVLPAYPGDGSTICMSRDRCHWRIIDQDDHWECWWTLEASAQHCDDCLDRANTWNPLIVPKV